MTFIFNFLGDPIATLVFLLLFLGAALVQFALLLSVFARLSRWKGQPAANSPPPISVIVCARNEASNLRQNLPALLAQDYAGDWELLVVDDASTDDSKTWLAAQAAQNPRLRPLFLHEKNQVGKKHALEQGIAAARYEVLAVTDADCVPASAKWLSSMALTCSVGGGFVLGYAPFFPAKGLLNIWARYEVAHTATLYLGFAMLGLPYMGVGRNLLWEKELFARNGGFSRHRHLASGDDDLLVNEAATAQNVSICLRQEATFISGISL
jgi:poly-beta-1,6-N-acetyl-D-glucosamine synthase